MSVTVVGYRTGIMPVEILNLGDNIYVASSFTNGKISPAEECDILNHMPSR